jgi:hypothetical protein
MSRTVHGPDLRAVPPLPATRRTLLGSMGAALLLVAPAAGEAKAKAAELDGELLAWCAAALAIDRESDRLWDAAVAVGANAPSDHPAWISYEANEDATLGRWHELLQVIGETPARTPEGLRAKAATARCAMPTERVDDAAPCDRLALSLYADMCGRVGA